MSLLCFICNKHLAESETVTVDRGLKTLINASIERGDEFSEYLKDQTSVTVHVQCRKNYTRKCTITALKRKQDEEQASTSKISPPRTRARVSESFFCFKKCCLFCGDELNEELENKKALKYRRIIFHVTTLSFKEKILNIAQTRSDHVAKAVITRIEFEHDLVAAEAKYHKDCHNAFLRPTTGGQAGRPQSESTNLLMEEIFAHVENSDDCQFSLDELQNICNNSLDNRTIKLRLKLKYGDNSIFCNCKTGCNAKCGCKKVGLFCSLACISCRGQSCSNVESPVEEDSYDIGENTSDASLLEQFICTQQEEEEEEEGKEEQDSMDYVPLEEYRLDE